MTNFFVHESSFVDGGAEVGAGTKFGTSAIFWRVQKLAIIVPLARTALFPAES